MAGHRLLLCDPVQNRHLIKIKITPARCRMMLPLNQGSHAMPTDTIVVLIMAVAFGIFAGTLYWADVQTRALPK
jgi:hypothetical protein